MMNTTTSTDILDEDAADLQFPKDEVEIEDRCGICHQLVSTEPKILCFQCEGLILCLQCFSIGLETRNHRNYHRYRVDRRHIPIDPNTDWTPQDDLDLLQSLIEFGYGNLVDLGKRFPHKLIPEVIERVDELCGLNKAELRCCMDIGPQPVVPYQANAVIEDPPRYPAHSAAARGLAGYSAPRGDFEIEFDDNAESSVALLEDLENYDDPLDKALALAVVEGYNERLRERFRRKRIVRDHGLLLRKLSVVMSRYDLRLFVFMQVTTTEELGKLLDGLNMEEASKRELLRLRKYRELGLTRLKTIGLYDKLEHLRTEGKKELDDVQPLTAAPIANCQKRRVPQPLDVALYPGFTSLTPEEKELCANSRVLPHTYLSIKELLITESVSRGGLRLMSARQLVKIDVNKTRKIFNFLRDEGLIIEKKS